MELSKGDYPASRAGRNEVTDKVIAWLGSQLPGLEFSYTECASVTGFNPGSVSAVLSRLARDENPAVRIGARRGRWIVTGRPPSPVRHLSTVPARGAARPPEELRAGEVLEVIMHTQDGVPVLKDERGMAWKAVPL